MAHFDMYTLYSVIVQRSQLKRSESMRVSKDADLDKRKYMGLSPGVFWGQFRFCTNANKMYDGAVIWNRS